MLPLTLHVRSSYDFLNTKLDFIVGTQIWSGRLFLILSFLILLRYLRLQGPFTGESRLDLQVDICVFKAPAYGRQNC